MLASVLPPLLQPVGELVADLADRRPRLLERAPHALAVVRRGAVRLVAQGRLLADPQVVAPHDPVVLAPADPLEELADAPDRQRVRHLEVLEEPREAVDARALLLV